MYTETITGQQVPPSPCYLPAKAPVKYKTLVLPGYHHESPKSHFSIAIHLCHFRIIGVNV